MGKLTMIAMDMSKHVFTLHGVDERGKVLLRRELHRQQLDRFFGKLPPVEVVLEACGGSHHWGRVLTALGHRVRLIPPQYVKPFVKRSKNDRIDAEAIAEAAQRPSMRFVPVKSAETQAEAMILSVRALLMKQRTQLVNAVRGHAAEFGVIAAKGTQHVAALLERLAAEPAVPAAAQAMFGELGAALAQVSGRIAEQNRKLTALHKNNALSQQLTEVPGIGPVSGLTLALTADARQFQSGRHFAAWLGLTPRQNSTGGKHRLGKISRKGNEQLRALLVNGATAVVRYVKPEQGKGSAWLQALVQRRPRKVVAVALANKMARVVWATMPSGEAYRRQPAG